MEQAPNDEPSEIWIAFKVAMTVIGLCGFVSSWQGHYE